MTDGTGPSISRACGGFSLNDSSPCLAAPSPYVFFEPFQALARLGASKRNFVVRGLLYALYFIRGVPETLKVRAESYAAVAQLGEGLAAVSRRAHLQRDCYYCLALAHSLASRAG